MDAQKELNNPKIRNIFKGKIITGVEFSTIYNGEGIEILGYNIDLDIIDEFIKKSYLTGIEYGKKELELTKEKYTSIGVRLDFDGIVYDPNTTLVREVILKEIRKHPENDRFFLNLDSKNCFSLYTREEVLNPKSPLYINREEMLPTLEDVISIIHQSGGIAFLAHPFTYSNTIMESLEDIIKQYDLDGLECYYTTFTTEQTNILEKLC